MNYLLMGMLAGPGGNVIAWGFMLVLLHSVICVVIRAMKWKI